MRTFWFKRRRYGWGWYPVTWQGWLVVAIYVVLVGMLARWESPWALGSIAFATGLLLVMTGLTGPRPRWRWGPRSEDNPEEDY